MTRRPTGLTPHAVARPIMADVAARAGVSLSTVSLAFAGSPRVMPDTRERVLAAAAELGYSGPDPTAASLRRGRTGVIGVFVGDRLRYAFRDPTSVQVCDGMAEVLGSRGIGLLLLAGEGNVRTFDQVARLPLDAAIFATCGLEDDPMLDLLRARGVPLVGVDGPAADDVVLIDIDDRRGTAELAVHLRDLGHRRVAVIAMPMRLDNARGLVGPTRRSGIHYRAVRRRIAGVEDVFGPVPIVETASNTVAEGETAGRVVLERPTGHRPTAVIAQSDVLAAGVWQAATRLGLRVPEDVSITGFDGADLPWLPGQLTTVVQPAEAKGRAAARAAITLAAGERAAGLTLPVTPRIGTTTGPSPRES